MFGFSNNYSQIIDAKLEQLPTDNLNEFGVDPFGLDHNMVKKLAPFAMWLYEKYFRCEVFGAKNVPGNGRLLVISNHSGQIPMDGMMVNTAFILEPKQPRLLRGMAEKWAADLPFINNIFSRSGQVVGIPSTCKKLLELEEAVVVFPEGVGGINKLFKNRYKLANFGTGFMRLAMETNTPILPVSVIGAEEQAPAIANLKSVAKFFGLPNLPVIFPQIIPLPLPTKYRIHIGKPMHFDQNLLGNEEAVNLSVDKVKNKIQKMINSGLKSRQSIFF